MSTTATAPAEGPPTLARGVDLLARVADAVDARETAVREVVLALAELNRAGVVETLEGLPIDVWLSTTHGWTAAERRMLLDTGDVLSAMPALSAWWDRGIVSWSVVRDVVAKARRLGRAGRLAVDGRLAASDGLLEDMDPDQVGWAVDEAVEEVRGAAAKQREEERARRESFLAMQEDLFGGGWVSGYLDPVGAAVATGGLDRRAEQDVAQAGSLGSKGKDWARALVGMAADELGGELDVEDQTDDDDRTDDSGPDAPTGPGGDGPGPGGGRGLGHPLLGGRRSRGRPAKPLFIVHVPLDRVTATAAGLLEVDAPGMLPRLSAALVENLAGDADVRAVLFDGARPLCVTRKTTAKEVPADTRLAVKARDLGARDPTGRTPAPGSQVHHLTPGFHHPDRLVTVSKRGHLRIVHRHGWTGRVDPDDGVVTWTRGHKIIRTVPWGTTLNRPNPPDGSEPERPAR